LFIIINSFLVYIKKINKLILKNETIKQNKTKIYQKIKLKKIYIYKNKNQIKKKPKKVKAIIINNNQKI
jgi:hypothetical protein